MSWDYLDTCDCPTCTANKPARMPVWPVILVVITLILIALVAGLQQARGQEILPVPVQVQPNTQPPQQFFIPLGQPLPLAVMQEIYPTTPFNPLPVTFHKPPHDADTLTDVTVHLPFHIDLAHVSIRAYGYDAWEVNRVRHSAAAGEITDAEIVKGLLARQALINLLLDQQGRFRENRLYVDYTGQRDPYGRYSCWLYIQLNDGPKLEWLNLAAYMRANGHQRTGPPVDNAEIESPAPPAILPPPAP